MLNRVGASVMSKSLFQTVAFFIMMLPMGGCESILASSANSGQRSTSARAAPATATVTKSIRSWVTCNGTTDDSLGVASAFAAAKGNAFTLIVDCPVYIHSGLDIARVIYIDDGTTVEFTGAGKFTIDNVMHPAFVIANSSNINLTNWDVEYDASLPANPDVGGFADNGQFVAVSGRTQPTGVWNDIGMTPWLTAHRAIIFDKSQGSVTALWASPTNTCAAFYITGDTSNVTVTGMNVHVPTTAGGDRFVPVVFSISMNFKSKQTVTAKTPRTAQFFAVPHDLTFSNITFDGTYMGWVGGVQNVQCAGRNDGAVYREYPIPSIRRFAGCQGRECRRGGKMVCTAAFVLFGLLPCGRSRTLQ